MNTYSEQIKKLYKPINKDEQFELFELYRNKGSKKAYNNIFYSALNFVISVAHKYKNQGVELEDLIQVGNVGLDTAIKRFDHNKNVKFISYAVNWIRQAMLQELAEQSRFVKITGAEANKQFNVNKVVQSLEQELLRTPTLEEIAKKSKISIDELKVMAILEPQRSLDAENPHTNQKLSDTLADNKFLSPENYAMESISAKIVDFVDNSTIKKDEDKEIIKRFFGIGKPVSYNQREIAEDFGCTPESIRQKKNKGVETLVKYNEVEKRESRFHLTPDML